MGVAPEGKARRTALCGAAVLLLAALRLAAPAALAAQDSAAVREHADSVTIRFVEADLRSVITALGRYLPKPVLTANIPPIRVSLETPKAVSRATAGALLRGLVENQHLEFVEEAEFIRVFPKPTEAAATTGTSAGPAPPQLFVVRLKHARAADVAATVSQLFGGGAYAGSGGGGATGTLSDELRRNVVPPASASGSVPAGSPFAPRGANLSGALTVIPDALTNSLLVRASRQDFDVLKEVVDQLDIRPLQVLIEVLIVEARHDRSFSLGSDLILPKQNLGGDQTVNGTLAGGGIGDVVLHFMNLGKPNIDAVLGIAAARGNVKIVSRPVLLASNNTEARFLVGSQRPFVQVSRSLPTDTPSRDQVVQYRDVGTKLTVRPTINQDGYVSLFIQQEINAATNETQFDAPVISTREAVTQVLVRDGQTIVIGGLRDEQHDRTSSGVPLLSGIPLIGGLFGHSSRRSSQTELYLFLTPRIIRTDDDADRLTAPRLPEDMRPERTDSVKAAEPR